MKFIDTYTSSLTLGDKMFGVSYDKKMIPAVLPWKKNEGSY